MQLARSTAVLGLGLGLGLGPPSVSALTLRNDDGNTPITKVLTLLRNMEARAAADAKKEQQTYDKMACWCEDTTARKSRDIAEAKQKIDELDATILKLSAETATHAAEAANLKKAIASNRAAQKEATEVRSKERAAYEDTKNEAEQSIGALEAAVKALSGAGEGKFLETGMEQANFLTVAAAVRPVLERPTAERVLSMRDLEAVRLFAARPQDFVKGGRGSRPSALQVANNPFGDYAPQSTQIQGILKGLYDSFASSLEKANGEESTNQKTYKDLMDTKKKEEATLSSTFEQHSLDEAEKSKTLADSKQLRDDTKVQLDADKKFFEDTKHACAGKAAEWSERSRLRVEELQGIAAAIEVLSGPEAMATFKNASTTLLQVNAHRGATFKEASTVRRVQGLAAAINTRSRNSRSAGAASALMQQAAAAASSGHFDKVMASIDEMIAVLRAEEQADIEHRDRCQGSQNKNRNEIEDLNSAVKKSEESIGRLDNKMKAASDSIKSLEGEIKATNDDLDTSLKLRNKENTEFTQALQDDISSVELIEQAIVLLSKFYEKNKIPLAMVQQKPEYSVDPNKMPESFDGSYKGQQGEHKNVVGMLSAIKEDLENEIKTGRKAEADAQAEYEEERDAMRESLRAQEASKVEAEKQLAELGSKRQDTEEFKGQKEASLGDQNDLKATLDSDCAWVKTHFETRRTKRKAEISGLQDAKDYLAGVESGSGI
eukprot:TRINITY_DN54437_c0_g1_i1.p1 TRINITY_DN54437_c0_g1~~TRINITY_DN54437_c0_g1_i1.p1  ORF type:complete len:738 (+),score=207.04 TRINITY_DN54437_c0_g1_i1:58-2214(+)